LPDSLREENPRQMGEDVEKQRRRRKNKQMKYLYQS
jgi:hypothetical protein